MSADKLTEDKFDKMLTQALQQHSEPVPADFTERMSKRIREDQERRILAQVVLQERLSLAGCIAFGVIAIGAVMLFPRISVSFTELIGILTDKISQTIKAISYGQLPYTVLAGVFGFAVYSIADLLVGDS